MTVVWKDLNKHQ